MATRQPLRTRIQQITAMRSEGLPRKEIAQRLGTQPDTINKIEWIARRRGVPEQGQPPAERVLTCREVEVLALRAEGLSCKQIGRRLHCAPSTVATHCKNARITLGGLDVVHTVAIALRRGILS